MKRSILKLLVLSAVLILGFSIVSCELISPLASEVGMEIGVDKDTGFFKEDLVSTNCIDTSIKC